MIEVEYPNRKPVCAPARRIGVVRLLVVLLGLAVGFMTSSTAPALAGQVRLLTGVFGAANSTPADPYPLTAAAGMAVDFETHDVYVADFDAHRVEKFDSAGHFILMFGKEVDRTTGGDVCTAASGDVCQAGVSGSSPGAFELPSWVAVDNSGVLGQQGDVYVADDFTGVVSKFNAEGDLISTWGNNGEGPSKNGPPNGQLNGSNATGKVKGPFGIGIAKIAGLAVDRFGDLWVNANGDMFKFAPDSSFLTGWPSAYRGGEVGIAVDAEDNLYIGGNVGKFDSTGTEIGGVLEGSGEGLTADPIGSEVYVAVTTSGEEPDAIYRYGASCHPHGGQEPCAPVEVFGSSNLQTNGVADLAIDPSTSANTLYVAERRFGRILAFSVATVPDVLTAKASGFTNGAATLSGSVSPSGVELEPGLSGCRFEWGEHGAGEPDPYGHSAPCDKTAAQIGSGSSPVEVRATVTGLKGGQVYHFRLVAGNHNQVNEVLDEPSLGADFAFGPPSIESTSAIDVGSDSATVQGQVSPNNVDTRVRVEYGREAGVYGHSTPELALGSGGTGQLVSFQLLGLEPHAVYHYRIVAENALGEGAQAILGSDQSFTTQGSESGHVLPDGRAWEMVSPPDKHGAALTGIGEFGMVQASAEGDAITYLSNLPIEAEPAGNDGKVQVLSRRAPGGWSSQDIATPHDSAVGVALGYGGEYRFFSSDLSLAVVNPLGGFVPQLSPEASEQTPYLRTDYPPGEVDSPCLRSCYRPLVTGAAGYENVPPETAFAKCPSGVCAPQFVGASSDLSHVVLSSTVALTEGAPTGQLGSEEGGLYEWSGGKLVLVSVLPDELPAPAGTDPSLGKSSGGAGAIVSNTVSSDGSRIIWSDADGLYVRDSVREKTVQVGSSGAQFQTASSDGSKILFTENKDLRECVIVENEGELHCEVSDLTPVGAGQSAGVERVLPSVSDDLSYVYFVAGSVLQNNGVPVSGAQPGECSESVPADASCNLYVRHEGSIKLVAMLSGDDRSDWAIGGSVRVSSDGRWLAFMSDRPLTGYDNRDAVNGRPDQEVYLYDASAKGGAGALVCASCDPTGARPHGVGGVAANVPGWTAYRLSAALYQSRYLSDGGRLFFDSSDALVPQDSNGTGDVYEYEPSGVGDCTTAIVTFNVGSGGCVGLISSGTSKEESNFVDASEGGDDVFFLTAAQLSHGDTDSSMDVYDARVGGGFAEPTPGPVCEGDACQSPVSAPEDPTPGSLTYSGPGNPSTSTPTTVISRHKAKPLTHSQKLARALAACKRDKSERTRSKCTRNARKRYGPIKAKRVNTKNGKR
jgi:hypothetical protein